jgi:lipopolysaccharide/colanic/teichoic acid biosynthesis glycosyltransferase
VKLKRFFDLVITIPGLVILSPLMLCIALLIKLDNDGPVLYRQKRIGWFGKPFNLLKYRTMVVNADLIGPNLTTRDDSRITRIGGFLRKYKLDELPQIINVLRGEMSLVGPRPEVSKYVAVYPQEVKEIVLSVPPGITDYAAIEYVDESDLLASSDNPEKKYIEDILPVKLESYQRYVKNRSLLLDFVIILKTVKTIFIKR